EAHMGDDMMTAETTRSSPWKVMARAIRLLPRSIQRRLIVVAGMAAVMAVMEAASFALLFYLIQVLTDPKAALPGVAGLLGASHDADSFLAGVGVTLALVQPLLAAGVVLFMALVGTGLLAVLAPAARRVGHSEAVESTLAQQALQESMGGIKAIKANELTSKFLESFSARR